MMEGQQTEAPACNPIEILDLILSICQDPHKASSPDMRRRMEGLTLVRGGGRASPGVLVSEMEALQQAMELLREKEQRGRLELAEAKRANLALQETNRARSVEALEQAEEAASMAQKLLAAYQMHEDLKEEVLAGYHKIKQDEEAKRSALNCELLVVEDKCNTLREESHQSKEREEAMRIDMVAAQKELARLKAVQQECNQLREEMGRSQASMQNVNANEEALRLEVATARAEMMQMKAEQEAMLHASHHRDASIVKEIQAREAALEEALARALEGMADRQAETEGVRRELVSLKEEQAESVSELEKAQAEAQVLLVEMSKAKEESARWRTEAEAALETSSSRAVLSNAQQDSLKAELLSVQRELARMNEAAETSQRKAIAKLSTVELAFATAQEELERLSEAAEAAQKESTERLTTMMELQERENTLAAEVKAAQEEIVRWKDAATAARAKDAEALFREKSTLEAQLQAAQDELSRWKEATDAAQQAAAENSASLEKVHFRESELTAEVQAAQGELARWKEEAKAAQNEAAGMFMSLADLDAEVSNAKAELARSRAAAESDLEESSSKLSAQEASLGELRSRQAALVEEVVAMKAALAKSQAKEKTARKEMAALREQGGRDLSVVKASLNESLEQHALLETKLVALQQELTRWQKAAEAAKNEAARIASSVTGLEHDVTTATAEATRWKKEAERARVEGSSQQASLQTELTFLQQKLADVHEGEGKSQILLVESKARIGTLEAELAHAQAELARSRAAAESDLEESSSKLSAQEASLGELRSRQAALVEEVVAMKAALAKSQAKEKTARKEMAALREQGGRDLSVVKASLNESLEQHALLETKLVALQQELTRWQKAAEAAKNEAARIASSVTGLEHDVTTATAEATRWKKEAERAREEGSSQQASLQTELSFLQQKLAGVHEGEGKSQILLVESKARIGTLEAELAHAQAELARSRAAAESDLEESSSKLSAQEASLGELRSRQAALVEEVVAMKAALARSQAKEQTVGEEMAALREQGGRDLSVVKASLNESLEQHALLETKLVALQQELTRWQKAAEAAKNEAARIASSVTGLEHDVTTATAEATRWKKEAERARVEGSSQQASLQTELTFLQQKLAGVHEGEGKSQILLVESKARIGTLEAELAHAQAKLARSRAAAESDLEESSSKLSAQEASLGELRSRQAALVEEVVAMKAALARSQAKEQTVGEEMAALREQGGRDLSVVKASLNESLEQHALLETKLVALQQELTRWQKAAEAAKNEAARIASSVTGLEHDVTTATAEATRWKKEAERARVEGSSQQASLQTELTFLQQKLAGVHEGEGKSQILLVESKARIGTLEAELAHAQAKLARSQSSAESDLEGSSSKLSAQEASLAQLRAQEAARTKKMVAIQAKLAACQAKEQTAQKENAQLREAAKNGLCSLAASRDSVKAELVSTQKELARSLKAAKAAQKEAVENLTALTESQARQAELMAEVQSVKDELARCKTESETARTEGKLQDSSLQAELLLAQQELRRMCEAAEAAQKEAVEKSLSLDELRSREANLVAQMDAADHEMARLKKEAEMARMDGILLRETEVKSQSQLVGGDASIQALEDRSTQWKEVTGTVQVGERADSQSPPVGMRTLEAEKGISQVESSSKLTLLEAALAEARSHEAAAVKEALLIKEEMMESQASAQAAREEIAALRYQTSKKKSSLEAALAETRKRAAALEVELAAATEELTQWRVEAKAAREECIVLMTELRKLKGTAEEVDQGQRDPQLQLEPASASVVRQASICIQGVPSRIFLIEVGSWRIRAGWIEVERPENFNPTHFPCVVARPKRVSADFVAIVQNASIQANAMYARFRRDGIFVGKDAWYCALDHPDPVLRGALKLEAPFVRDRLERPGDLKWLLRDVLDKMNVDAWEIPLVVTYKATTTREERAKMVEITFEPCEASRVRFLNESSILASLANEVTALVIDVGEDTTRVVPVFEQVVITKGIQTSALGGSDLTNYMSHMLLSCRNEVYSSLVERKMLEVARWIKERHAYVALDFKEEIGRHGSFEREKIDVMRFQRDQIKSEESAVPGRRLDVAIIAEPGDVPEDSGDLDKNEAVFRSPLSDGQELTLRVGRERFHCGELLFRPELFPDIGPSLGMTDLVLESLRNLDLDLWSLMLPHVLLAGQTTRIPGFAERLTAELKATLPEEYAALVNVRMLEEGNTSGKSGDEEGEDRNQDPESPFSPDIPAVSRAVAACARKVVQGEEGWMSVGAYSEFGAEALEKPVYSFMP